MNKVVLSGRMKELPIIQKMQIPRSENMMVALFEIDDGADVHECFAVGEPVKVLLNLDEKDLEEVTVEGVLCNYHYKDIYHTPHKTKYVLVHNFEALKRNVRCECREEEKEQIGRLHRSFIEKGLHPVVITNNYA